MISNSIAVILPDGSHMHCHSNSTLLDVAAAISPGLARNTVAGYVDEQLVDAVDPVTDGAHVKLLTTRDDASLPIIRHSCAHLVGHAVKQLYPSARMVIGPVIDDGFFYDIAYERTFTADDLAAIESRMRDLIDKEYDVIKRVLPRAEVISMFKQRGEHYKLRLIDELPDEQLALYFHEEYVDMCRGPHVPNTRLLKHFKLTRISGAYWRGDARNEQLQRIYGTAWADKKGLKQHLTRLAEAEQRDHRKLGRELDLYHFDEDAPGAVFWHPHGWTLFQTLLGYMRRRQQAAGFIEVNTPDVMDRRLWEVSGHWQNYRANMFTTQTEDERVFALKPMSCPGSVLLYRNGLKSHHDLPIRMAEFGKVHRYEPSGSLHGLMRVRHFTQDDAHIYCTPSQLYDECRRVVALVLDIYAQFGFQEVSVKLSTRPENKIGDDRVWDELEAVLTRSLQDMQLDFYLNPGEGAFYGPKLEFVLRDAIGRDWQCGTLQVDMNLPERFKIEFVDESGKRERPVMLHCALFGSLERFTGILIEHHAGRLPPWLAPVQVVVLSITDDHVEYVNDVAALFQSEGLRVNADTRNEKLGYKIRSWTLQRVPFIVIAGGQECATGAVALRDRNGVDLGVLSVADAVTLLLDETQAPDHAQLAEQRQQLLSRLVGNRFENTSSVKKGPVSV